MLGYHGIPSKIPLPPYPIPAGAILRRPSVPSGGLGYCAELDFGSPTAPADGDTFNITVAIAGPPGGYTFEWDDDASTSPGNIPLVFTGTDDTPQELAVIIIAAIFTHVLPFTCVYDNTPGSEKLFITVGVIPPPFGPDSITNLSLNQTAAVFNGTHILSSPYNDGTGLAAIPLFPGAPRAVLVSLPALPPETPPGPKK